jgi:hypothetical protein
MASKKPKPIASLSVLHGEKADYTSLGSIRVCPCGSEVFHLKVKFDEDNTIAMYFLDMICVDCTSAALAPVPGVEYE